MHNACTFSGLMFLHIKPIVRAWLQYRLMWSSRYVELMNRQMRVSRLDPKRLAELNEDIAAEHAKQLRLNSRLNQL
jgi:hypothetical protein